MESDASFGWWLRRRRKALDLTQEALAVRVGCSVATIRKIEVDERRPSRHVAELLADALDISAKDRPAFLRVARGERGTQQLAHVTPPADHPADRPLPAALPRLPIPLTPLIGRAAELAELRNLIGRADCRLLSIVGPGGIGKTRLAIAAATEQSGAFANGVVFVALAPLSSSEFIVSAIAEAAGCTFYGPTAPKTQLLNYLTEKRMLLVLDNIEHLLDGVGQLAELLQRAANVKLLVTSRERLQLLGEWVFELHGLAVPPAHQADHLEAYSAVGLFVECAHRARTSLALSEQNQAAVARICQLVEGLPLGIELAAAWAHELDCREIADQIERNLDFLAASRRDVPERHRSMRAVFDHSWHLLSEGERRVLSRLSVFRGGCTREAAEHVAGATLAILASLVAKSLLRRTEAGRYDLHELVRQYAHRQLQAAESSPTTQRCHADFFLRLAEEAEAALWRPQQVAWLERLEHEHDNLRAALQWSVEQRETQMTARLAGALWRFWEAHNYLSEGRSWLELALDGWIVPIAEGSLGEVDQSAVSYRQSAIELRVKALNGAGILANDQGDYARARELIEESLLLCRMLADKRSIATTLNHLAAVAWFQADHARHHATCEESYQIYRGLGDRRGIARSLSGLATAAFVQGNYERSVALLDQSLALYRELGDPQGIALTLCQLAGAAKGSGHYQRARELYADSLARFRDLGALWGVAYCLDGFALVAIAQAQAASLSHGQPGMAAGEQIRRAARLWGAAEALREAAGFQLSLVDHSIYADSIAAGPASIGETAWAAAWAEGRAMMLDQAITGALLWKDEEA